MVKDCDVLKDVLHRLRPCPILAMMNEFPLQGAQEAFDTGVVPAIPSTRHTPRDAGSPSLLLVDRGRILTPAIGRVQETGLRLAPMERHL